MLVFAAILAVAVCNFGLGLIVLVKNRHSLTNIAFSLFAVMLSVWLIANYYSNNMALDYQVIVWLNRSTLFVPPIALYCLFMFSLLFTGRAHKHIVKIGTVLGVTALGIAFLGITPLVFGGIEPREDVVAVLFGPLILVYGSFIVAMFLGLVAILLGSLSRLNGSAKMRTKYMAGSLFLALLVTVVTNLVLPLFMNNYAYIQLGLVSTIIIVGGFAYAIIRHRLFDIRTVVARSATYVLLLLTLSFMYTLVAFKIGGLIFGSSSINTPQQTFNIITAIVLAFTFQPLRRFFEKLTDKVFYRDRYDPEHLINQIGQVLASEIELVGLSRRVRSLLSRHMRVDRVNIVVLNNNKVFAEAGHYVVSELEGLARDLAHLSGRVIIADEEREGKRKQTLQKYGIGVFVALRTREGKIGYLLLGNKLSGDIYTGVDLRVIDIIADQLAVAIQNAKAYVQIQQFNQTLKTKVNDATKQLRDANANLHQLDKVKDDFISMASHQLRTPLTVSEGYLANIIDGMYGQFSEQQKQVLSITLNNLHLTASLVSDLLNISRMEAGRFFIDAKPTDLNDIVPEEINQLRIRAQSMNVALIYKAASEPVPILSLDGSKTRQAIMNLIDNAIYYTPQGQVTVSLRSDRKNVVFEVTDTGIGVPAAQQAQLFAKFFRADNAKLVRTDGTGIGLYLVKRVIEDQGGSIIFSSREGKGSTFGFRLPLPATITPQMPPPQQEPANLITSGTPGLPMD